MNVEIALCQLCGDEYVHGFNGEHAADAHKVTLEAVRDLLDRHWAHSESLTDPSCGCGWHAGDPGRRGDGRFWEEHFIRVLAEARDR
jgi:hypothetical protein